MYDCCCLFIVYLFSVVFVLVCITFIKLLYLQLRDAYQDLEVILQVCTQLKILDIQNVEYEGEWQIASNTLEQLQIHSGSISKLTFGKNPCLQTIAIIVNNNNLVCSEPQPTVQKLHMV